MSVYINMIKFIASYYASKMSYEYHFMLTLLKWFKSKAFYPLVSNVSLDVIMWKQNESITQSSRFHYPVFSEMFIVWLWISLQINVLRNRVSDHQKTWVHLSVQPSSTRKLFSYEFTQCDSYAKVWQKIIKNKLKHKITTPKLTCH